MTAIPIDASVRKALAAGQPTGDWKSFLIRNEKGAPKGLLANCLIAFRQAPAWQNVLAFNEFSFATTIAGAPPWGGVTDCEWTDNHDRLGAEWLQTNGIHVSVEIAAQAVQTAAIEKPFHPVRDYLNTLKWDGEPRVDAWLTTYLGVEATEYSSAIGRRWLISGVARIFQPGAKADCCLILEGPQGAGKSTALRTLGGQWFADELAELGSKDAALQTRGAWIIELAELDSMTRSEVGRIKAFMSRSIDRFRPPYGKRLIESPRQCVFAGSVNHNDYLRDETGGRRFWPIECREIRLADLQTHRDQLWAEAVALFRKGHPWWLEDSELVQAAVVEQEDRFEGDPWQGLLAAWLESRTDATVEAALQFCIEKPKGQWTAADRARLGRCFKALGWVRRRLGPRDAREYRYERPVSR